MRMVKEAVKGAASAGFGTSALDLLLSPEHLPDEPWRTGEALAECYLEDCEGALLPHPRLRDERNPFGSSAGPDLVGYAVRGSSAVFLFGEVKTTRSAARPPSVVRDLRAQLKPLLSRQGVRHLVLHLIKKAQTSNDPRCRKHNDEALKSYAASKWDTAGVLISDREPDSVDLEAAFVDLGKGAGSAGGSLRLVGLYVPVPIGNLGKTADAGGSH